MKLSIINCFSYRFFSLATGNLNYFTCLLYSDFFDKQYGFTISALGGNRQWQTISEKHPSGTSSWSSEESKIDSKVFFVVCVC